ncbi:tetratricopeptide repeat protein [Spirosoma sp. KUDC1026]|uniref:tetratricopeptide repeat protein n=1 Tax=Spirosoma sp. KUDC1026 TaxID=2745947 RepID=UPI00159BD3FB|nr:tetratricopeptide repeat protein [Spirosoma sp. KUDC1026]QKZ12012.1 tetratricopeptide repeat protein [Spirosoma sp. KUDC1026]
MKKLLVAFVLTCSITAAIAQDARSVTQAIHFIKLASTLREVNKSDESISLLKRALPAVQSKNLYWEAVANEMLGTSYNDLEDYDAAVHYLEIARGQYAQLKYVASAWGVNEIIRDISGKNLYAGIQVGASDIKLAIFKTQYESDFYEKDIRSVINIPDITLVSDASGAVGQRQLALKSCLDSIQRYNIPNERVFIVFSSDVKGGKESKLMNKNRLYDELASILPGGSSLKIDTTLTAEREAELFTIGAIPRKVWPTTFALNLGNTSTMGGYFDANKSFHHTVSPLGVMTLVNQVDPNRTMALDTYREAVQKAIAALPEGSLAPAGSGFQQRKTIGVGGDIIKALVTYLHPDKSTTTAVAITKQDIDQFKRLALSDYASLVRPDLSYIGDPAVLAKASQDIRTMQNLVSQKQLIAGALLLEATANDYARQGSSKRMVFIRDSDIGWVTGKFLETINFEYESTIAKGSLYTR